MAQIRKIIPDWRTILSAVLLALAAPVWNQGYLVFIAFVPFLYGMNQWNLRKTLLQSFWFQLLFSFGVFFWVPPSFYKLWPNGNIAVYTGFFLGLMAIVELQIVGWAYVRHYLKRYPLILILLGSSIVYTGLDMLALKFVKDTLAHALFEYYSIKQWSGVIGVYGLTAFIMIINELFFVAIQKRKKLFSLIPIGLVAAAYLSGPLLIKDQKPKGYWSVALIQPNIGHYTNPNDKKGLAVLEKLISLSENALVEQPETKYVIWPETIYPADFFNPNSLAEEQINKQLVQWVLQKNIHLFFGALIKENGLLANAYIHIYSVENQIKTEYILKNNPFPFGEEIPFTKYLPWMRDVFPIPSVSVKGTGPVVQNIEEVKVGNLICFESITAELTKEFTLQGVELLLNPTNEASFTSFGEPQLALALTSFRALEIGVSLIRVADTGISAYIDAHGVIRYQTPMDQVVIKTLKIPIFSKDKY